MTIVLWGVIASVRMVGSLVAAAVIVVPLWVFGCCPESNRLRECPSSYCLGMLAKSFHAIVEAILTEMRKRKRKGSGVRTKYRHICCLGFCGGSSCRVVVHAKCKMHRDIRKQIQIGNAVSFLCYVTDFPLRTSNAFCLLKNVPRSRYTSLVVKKSLKQQPMTEPAGPFAPSMSN